MPPAGVSLLCGPTVNLLSVTCTAVSFPWCQSVLMLSLLSVSILRSRFVDFSFSCNSVSVSVSCLGFFVMNSVTGLVGVSVCFSFGD